METIKIINYVLMVVFSIGQSLSKLCLTVFLLRLMTAISEWKPITHSKSVSVEELACTGEERVVTYDD